jgi:hypothetical protein
LEVDEDSPEIAGGDAEDEEAPRKKPADEEGDEGVGEEDGEEGEEDEREEGEEDENEAAFLAQEVDVIVDGNPVKVSLKEALEGYVRTQTFHQRMNDVEEAKQIIAKTASDAVANYEYTMAIGQEIQAYLDNMIPEEPNWDEMFKQNPIKAREMQKYYEQVRGFKTHLQGKLDEASAKQRVSDTNQLRAYAFEESRRFDQLNAKSWAADPKRKSKDLQAMRRTALSQGFSEEELSQVYDSRMLSVLLKASRYDRMMASKPKPVVQEKRKEVASGSGPARTKRATNNFSSAMKRLNKTGRIDDAAVVMDQLIRRDG